MDSQIARQDGLEHDQNNPSGMEGQEDSHPGKTSVLLKKVKAKARKIKDGLKKKDGNGDQDNNQNGEGHEEDENDDDFHDSVPMYESPAVMNTAAGQNPGGNLEKPTGMEEDPPAPKDGPQVSNYQSKVADPTGAGGKDAGVTGILHSFNKMNVDDEPESKPRSEEAPALYTGSHKAHDQFSPEPIPPQSTMNPVDPVSDLKSFDSNTTEDVPLDNVTKLPSNQSGYTERLSYTTSAIADKAIAAKNVVASKLGYGGNQDQTRASESTQGGEEIGKPGTTAEYGQKIVATVTEKLAPVYEKVSSVGAPVYEKVSNVGSSMVSKVRGTGTGQEGGVEGQDQGVSVKEYLAEKLRPGEEDKSLSEVISETLYTRKQGGEGEEGENQKPVGIVTESEEVRERLGSDDDPNREMTETESKISGNVSATGKGMVESVKGTVTSWFSKGGDQKKASEAASPGNTHGEEATTGYENGVGERRLQESGN